MIILKKAVLPKGFKANGLSCGLKKSGKADLALFYSDTPAQAACLFTSNKIIAAPLKLNKQLLKKQGLFQAILVNSGNANCFTGIAGVKKAKESADSAASALQVKQGMVLANSTGIIGKALDVSKIKKALPALVKGLSAAGLPKASEAIMTTDTFKKEIAVSLDCGKKKVIISACAKGAGMISPDMATLLCFIMTDADITAKALKQALKESVEKSFNCLTVDGCMSTNDSVMMFANGQACNRRISAGKDYRQFAQALTYVCLKLAKMIAKDGEGATKFIQITVDKARNDLEAKKAALAIANSNLFKTAVFGENPNFGRIFAAVGACGIEVDEESVKCKVSPLKNKEVDVYLQINKGKGKATVYTSDLTPEYVKINAEYN